MEQCNTLVSRTWLGFVVRITSINDSEFRVTRVGDLIIRVRLKQLQKLINTDEFGLSGLSMLQFASPRM
jgi:hypothetical protein